MFTRILITLVVIIGAAMYLKMRQAEQEGPRSRGPVQKKQLTEKEKMFRQGAYLFMVFMVISALVVFFFEIGDRYQTVNVHVVNTQTGERVSYQAEQQQIKSDHFTTLEGRTVYVADIERIEIERD